MLNRSLRRGLLLGAASLAIAAPLRPGRAQAPRRSRIGYLSLAPGPSPRSQALLDGLLENGLAEGRSIEVLFKWANGDLGDLTTLAAALVEARVDVIVTGGPAATAAARAATRTIPIVMAIDYDPVGSGFADSIARPGGNVTGISALNPTLGAKRLSLLREAVPGVERVAVFANPAEPNADAFLEETRRAAAALTLALQPFEITGPAQLEPALRDAVAGDAGGLLVLTDPVTLYHRERLAALARRYRVAAIYGERLFVEAGGLMSYGPNDRALHRRAASFVARILRGANPAEMPVEPATQYEFVIGQAAADALGVALPVSLFSRADEVLT